MLQLNAYSNRNFCEQDYVPNLTLLQRIMIYIFGYIAYDVRQYFGWKEPAIFYAFRCLEHGYVISVARGYVGRLECPYCIKRELEVLREELKNTKKNRLVQLEL